MSTQETKQWKDAPCWKNCSQQAVELINEFERRLSLLAGGRKFSADELAANGTPVKQVIAPLSDKDLSKAMLTLYKPSAVEDMEQQERRIEQSNTHRRKERILKPNRWSRTSPPPKKAVMVSPSALPSLLPNYPETLLMDVGVVYNTGNKFGTVKPELYNGLISMDPKVREQTIDTIMGNLTRKFQEAQEAQYGVEKEDTQEQHRSNWSEEVTKPQNRQNGINS
jgi:hypothetical protein